MGKDMEARLAIGKCPNCGQTFYGLWVLEETSLELHCPTCARHAPGVGEKLVKMRIEPIQSKKGGEW